MGGGTIAPVRIAGRAGRRTRTGPARRCSRRSVPTSSRRCGSGSSGRDFTERDTAGAPKVVIVNRRLARSFGLENPVGQTMTLGRRLVRDRRRRGRRADVHAEGRAASAPSTFRTCRRRRPPGQMTYEMRTAGNPAARWRRQCGRRCARPIHGSRSTTSRRRRAHRSGDQHRDHPGAALHRLCRAGADHRVRRALRDGRVQRRAAHERDRRPHDARRQTGPHRLDSAAGDRVDDRDRPRDRHSAGARGFARMFDRCCSSSSRTIRPPWPSRLAR